MEGRARSTLAFRQAAEEYLTEDIKSKSTGRISG